MDSAISIMEQTLEDIIMDNQELVVKRGFPLFYENVIRQFRLPSGKICDIVTFQVVNDEINCKIFELKKGELGIGALTQLLEYGAEFCKYASWAFKAVDIEIILIGNDISYDLFNMYLWGLNISIVTFDYKIDGIHFERDNYRKLHPPLFISNHMELSSKPTDDILIKFKKLFTGDQDKRIKDLQNKLDGNK